VFGTVKLVFHIALEYIAPAGDDAMAVSFEEVRARLDRMLKRRMVVWWVVHHLTAAMGCEAGMSRIAREATRPRNITSRKLHICHDLFEN
jgi:hypothetical protein